MFRVEAPTAARPGIDDLRAKEREEMAARVHQNPSPGQEYRAGGSGGVIFEPVISSPYDHPLGAQTYDHALENSTFGPNGLCPICNNSEHRSIDMLLIHNLWSSRKIKGLPFTAREIALHVIRHIGPVYSSVGSSASPENIARMKDAGVASALSGEIGMEVRRGLRRLRYVKIDDQKWEDDDRKAMLIVDQTDTGVEADPVLYSKEVRARPPGNRDKYWYAWEGVMQSGEMRQWSDQRTEVETVKRTEDAIVFYDEMLRSRRMAMEVYEDAMSDPEPILGKVKGGGVQIEYPSKNYGAAISAARLVKDVAMDLMKLALISSKIGDSKDKSRNLSPALQDMISDLGIFDEAKVVAPDE